MDELLGMEHNGNRLHVLVIEEDEAMRSACMEIATQRGFSAEGLPEAGNAQQLLRSHSVDLLLMEHPDLGLSMYDHHSDGSGVALSSRRRPVVAATMSNPAPVLLAAATTKNNARPSPVKIEQPIGRR